MASIMKSLLIALPEHLENRAVSIFESPKGIQPTHNPVFGTE